MTFHRAGLFNYTPVFITSFFQRLRDMIPENIFPIYFQSIIIGYSLFELI